MAPVTAAVWRQRALWPALLLFGIMASHGLLETARDALFLARLGAEQLAWAYLAIALAALGVVGALRRLRADGEPRTTLVLLLVAAAIGTAVISFTLGLAPSIVFVLYVWTGVVATLLVPTLWLVAERGLLLGDAKRLFGIIGAGGMLGAMAGAGLASVLSRAIAPHHLVSIAAVVLGATALAAIPLAPRALPAPADVPIARVARPTGSWHAQRYVRLLFAAGLIATVALTLGDLMFKRLLAERIPAAELAPVLGATYGGLNFVALVIQLAVTPRLIARLGVGGAAMVLPAILLVTSVGSLVTGAAAAAIALKIGDGGFRHSLHRVTAEILFMPLPVAVRNAAKPVIDAVAQRGGQAAAAALALIAAAGSAGTRELAGLTAIVAGLWLVVMALSRAAYVQQFRATLDANEIQRTARIPTLDVESVAMLTASLSSPDETEALAAVDLLARRGNQLPALVLYHPSPVVVRRALSLLEGDVRADVERVLGHLTTHGDPEIRAAALAAASRTGCHQATLLRALDDAEPAVRAAALVGLAGRAPLSPQVSAGIAALRDGTSAERIALVQAIARAPSEAFRGTLDHLAAVREMSVVRAVLQVWARAPELADLTRLTRLLEDSHLRGESRRAFEAGGPRALQHLLRALDDPRTPLGVRRHLPRTISRFLVPVAVEALVARLLREPDGTTEFKILRALGRISADHPKLAIDPVPIRSYVARALEDALHYATLGQQLAAAHSDDVLGPGVVLLAELLLEKRDQAIERVFRALGILNPKADLRSVYDAITSDDEQRQTAAREIVEDLLPASVRDPLFAMLDDVPLGTSDPPRAYDEVLQDLLEDPSDSLRCVAAHHVAERRLFRLRPLLARLRPASPIVRQAFEQAIARLDA